MYQRIKGGTFSSVDCSSLSLSQFSSWIFGGIRPPLLRPGRLHWPAGTSLARRKSIPFGLAFSSSAHLDRRGLNVSYIQNGRLGMRNMRSVMSPSSDQWRRICTAAICVIWARISTLFATFHLEGWWPLAGRTDKALNSAKQFSSCACSLIEHQLWASISH